MGSVVGRPSRDEERGWAALWSQLWPSPHPPELSTSCVLLPAPSHLLLHLLQHSSLLVDHFVLSDSLNSAFTIPMWPRDSNDLTAGAYQLHSAAPPLNGQPFPSSALQRSYNRGHCRCRRRRTRWLEDSWEVQRAVVEAEEPSATAGGADVKREGALASISSEANEVITEERARGIQREPSAPQLQSILNSYPPLSAGDGQRGVRRSHPTTPPSTHRLHQLTRHRLWLHTTVLHAGEEDDRHCGPRCIRCPQSPVVGLAHPTSTCAAWLRFQWTRLTPIPLSRPSSRAAGSPLTALDAALRVSRGLMSGSSGPAAVDC